MSNVSDYISKIKGWGFTALLAFALFIALFILGFKFASGVALGVFVTRNWDIIAEYVNKNV